MKNTKTKNKEFNYDKNETMIQMSNYLRAGARIRKTRKMVEVQNTVFPNKDSSIVKVMRSRVNIPPIKIHSPMRMMKNNPDKVHFKRSKVEQGGARWSKVEKNENRVCKKRDLVNNYENIEMVNRSSRIDEYYRDIISHSSHHLQLQALEHPLLQATESWKSCTRRSERCGP